MAENKPFVINDRRKFTAEGEPRPDAPQESAREERAIPASPERDSASLATAVEPGRPVAVAQGVGQNATQDTAFDQPAADDASEGLPPPPTTEETEQVTRAYDATVDRLDTAMRATNPGGERLPAMNFERMVQSLYMQSLLQLGGAAEPGQPPRVDLIGARQTIDMLSVLADKVQGNLSDNEDKLLQSALFELRMGFLEVTQALARQAASRQTGPGSKPVGPGIAGPSIVR